MKMLCMIAGLLAVATEAHMYTTAKLAWMQSKGVNLNDIADTKANMHTIAAKGDRRIRIRHEKKKARFAAKKLAQENGGAAPAGAEGEADASQQYWEEFTYGLIDGTTADFNGNCRDALKMTVGGSFSMYSYRLIYKPSSYAKFNLAVNQFMTGSSSTYAFCDFTAMWGEFAALMVTTDYEQYVTLSSRVMGAMISDIPKLKFCVKQGKEGGLGYDVGLCRGKMFTTLMDVTL